MPGTIPFPIIDEAAKKPDQTALKTDFCFEFLWEALPALDI